MTRYSKHEVIGKMLNIGLIPVFYNGDVEIAKKIVIACRNGGAKIVEFTNRGDFAYQVFSELEKWCAKEFPEVVLGVGSVIDPATAALYINNGANFIVGPIFNRKISRICARRKVVYSPGCGTASEISEAEEMGSDIVKVFPGGVVGSGFIKNMKGPCPWVNLMPTGGVDATRENVHEWIKAGAACLGIGSKLIRKDWVKAGDFEQITKKTEQVIWWIQEARGTPLFLGIEHVGLYSDTSTGDEIAQWYSKMFGLNTKEGRSSFFVSGIGSGRIEVMKNPEPTKCHIAIRVSNFEEACKHLRKKGIELEEPKLKKDVKAVFLKNCDPTGNKVHLIFRKY
jgi:2-dehydro-3-deoxyphosphogluconate aldolase/(4S)-4-hydroxy-2-oxoglutarate aldolase